MSLYPSKITMETNRSRKQNSRDGTTSAAILNDVTNRRWCRNGNVLEDNASVFDVLVYFFQELSEKAASYNYQVELPTGQYKEKIYDTVGTLSDLLGLDKSTTLSVLEEEKLVVCSKGVKFQFKRTQWSALCNIVAADMTFDGRIKRDTVFLVCVGRGKPRVLKDQIAARTSIPTSRAISAIQEKFQAHPSIQKLMGKAPPPTLENLINNETVLPPPRAFEFSTGEALSETTNRFNEEVDNGERGTNQTVATLPGFLGDNNIDDKTYVEEHGDDSKTQVWKGKRKKNERKMRYTDCNGKQAYVPMGFKLVHKKRINAWELSHEAKKEVKEAASKCRANLSGIDCFLVGTLASRFPQASDVAIEQMLCGGGMLCASQLTLFDPLLREKNIVTFDNIHQILPSRTSIGSHVQIVAANKIIDRGIRMQKASRRYICCDKGAGVLVKMVFFFDQEEKCIVGLNLDFDKSGEDAMGGGDAIRHSMRKYTFEDSDGKDLTTRFHGAGSDSGGGFTKDSMRKELFRVDLVHDRLAWIYIACTSHNDQTNLRSAILACYGPGGLEVRSVMQLIHSYSDTQNYLEGKDELRPLLIATWGLVQGSNSEAPKDFLALMQEPILTRWGTVGQALDYVDKYGHIIHIFCKGICGSKSRKTTQSVHQAAYNFRSLYSEPEIVLDCAFLADFDRYFFRSHLEFNHETDPHIGRSGFLAHHHLVRYFLKDSELRLIAVELETGEASETPSDQRILKNFWKKLDTTNVDHQTTKKVVGKAVAFVAEYQKSLHKHCEQWVLPGLVFYGTCSEFMTGMIVARHLLGLAGTMEKIGPSKMFKSTIHNKEINLEKFMIWFHQKCPQEVCDSVLQNSNFLLLKNAVEFVADGNDLWGNSFAGIAFRELYLENFAACPSTMEMIERSVKKARMCQKTGKGERNVTAYGIAGDGVSETCRTAYLESDYEKRMSEQRKDSREKAEANGQETRYKQKEFHLDIERGPGLTINIYNHALDVHRKACEIQDTLGEKEFDRRLVSTLAMLNSLDGSGSQARFATKRSEFLNAIKLDDSTYKPSVREKETGVDETPLIRGEVPLFMLLKNDNEQAIFQECVSRQLIPADTNPKTVKFSNLRNKIKAQIREQWIADNPGKEIPDSVGKTFKQVSGARFVVNYKK